MPVALLRMDYMSPVRRNFIGTRLNGNTLSLSGIHADQPGHSFAGQLVRSIEKLQQAPVAAEQAPR